MTSETGDSGLVIAAAAVIWGRGGSEVEVNNWAFARVAAANKVTTADFIVAE